MLPFESFAAVDWPCCSSPAESKPTFCKQLEPSNLALRGEGNNLFPHFQECLALLLEQLDARMPLLVQPSLQLCAEFKASLRYLPEAMT